MRKIFTLFAALMMVLSMSAATTWTVAGEPAAVFHNHNWSNNAAANDMVQQADGTFKWERTDLTLAENTKIQFKVCKDHGWTTAYPSSNYELTIQKSGIYTITITFNPSGNKVEATATLQEEQEVIATVAVKGAWDNWANTTALTLAEDKKTAATTIAVAKAGDFKFGLEVNGGFVANGGTVSRTTNSVANLSGNTGDMTLKADMAGDYTFTWEYATKTLTVTYPALPVKYNVTVTAENGTVTGDGEYEEGKTATLTATPAEGYQFVNWTVGEEVVSTENPYSFVVTADVALVANFEEAAPEYALEETVEIANLTTETLTVGEATYLQLTGRNDMLDSDVQLFLNNYTGEDKEYEVNVENSLMTFGGIELTVVEGKIAQATDPEKGKVYTGRVIASAEEEGEVMLVALDLVMYATPAVEVAIADATARVDEETGSLVLNAEWTKDGVAYPVFVTVAGYEEGKEVYEGAQISELQIGDDDNWLDFAVANTVTVAQDGQNISVEGEYTSWATGTAYALTISGKLPVVEPEVITYELNGGEFPAVVVPTNEELAMAFKQEYAEYFAIEGLTDTDMNREVGNFIYVTNSKGGDAVKFITENANWKWLADYIISVAAAIPEGTNVGYYWRANIDAFFHCKNAVAVGGVNSADFSEAGKPENWGAAYEAAHAVVLPTEPVAEDYVLPTPVKEGYTFVGWYDNAEGTGKAYTVIPAGWAGTLYAIWKQGTTTALENIAVEGKAVKAIINGQLIIIKNGVQYNAQGAILK